MKIEKIDFDEKKNAFLLNIDGESYLISYKKYIDLNIQTDQLINNEIFTEIQDENSFIISKNKAMNYAVYTQRTKDEVRKKLVNLRYEKSIKLNNEKIEEILDNLENIGLLDDENYAQLYAQQKSEKGMSQRKIEMKLLQKGIAKDTIKSAIKFIDNDIELQNAIAIISKKFADFDISDFKQKSKIYNHLAYQGFSSSIINKAIGDFYE